MRTEMTVTNLFHVLLVNYNINCQFKVNLLRIIVMVLMGR